jgi:hypothetical protein
MPDEEIDLEELKKDELVEEAAERGLPTSGTKDELIDRILTVDGEPGGNGLDYSTPPAPQPGLYDEFNPRPEFDPENPGGNSLDYGRPPEPEEE